MGSEESKPFQYGIFAGPKKKGETQSVRFPPVGEGKVWGEMEPGLNTMIKVFKRSVKHYPNRPMFATREKISKEKEEYGEYKYKTYKEVDEIVNNFAKGIYGYNLCPESETREHGKLKFLGIYSKNREEWLISDIASHMNSIIITPIYDTLGDDVISYILHETQMTTVAMESATLAKLNKLKEQNNQSKLQNIILFDLDNTQEILNAKKLGYTVYSFNDILEKGKTLKDNEFTFTEPKGDSIAILSYTSGTTGKSKGALLTHYQLVGCLQTLNVLSVPLDYNDVYMSYLPLAHIFERVINLLCIFIGACIAFYSGKTSRLLEDSQKAKPTVFIGVPRVFDRIYEGVIGKVKKLGTLARMLFEKAYTDKLFYLRRDGVYTHFFWDTLIFKKIRDSIGGRLRLFVVGGAPVTSEITEVLKILFSVPFVSGYGSTESCGASIITHGEEKMNSLIGGCVASFEYKLVDVPDLGYTSEDVNPETGVWEPKGEIMLRGVSPFIGYLNDKEKTKESVTEDGWIHTGDVGVIYVNHGNALKIIDRAKNIFKLSQGEYIAPEKIENILNKSPFISFIFVTGISTENYLVGIIDPNKQGVFKFLKNNGLVDSNVNNIDVVYDFYDNDTLKSAIVKDLDKIGRDNGLKGFELVKKVYLSKKEFSSENNLITPTLKLKRNIIKKVFANEINEMYKK